MDDRRVGRRRLHRVRQAEESDVEVAHAAHEARREAAERPAVGADEVRRDPRERRARDEPSRLRRAEVEVVLPEARERDAGAAESVDHRLAAEDAPEERPAGEIASEDEYGARVAPPHVAHDGSEPRDAAARAVAVDHGRDLVRVGDVEERRLAGAAAAGRGDEEGRREESRGRDRTARAGGEAEHAARTGAGVRFFGHGADNAPGVGKMFRVAGLLLVASVAACARRPEPAAGERALTIGLEGAIETLDPTFVESNTFSALSNVFEPLVDYDREMHLVPALAESWNAPDERTWVLKLRAGVTFHDGSPVHAAEVVASLERSRNDPVSEARARLASVERIEAVGRDSVQFRTTRPDALLLHELASVLVGKGATRAAIEKNPIGTGPYRVVRWDRGGRLELEAFAAHWRGAPAIRRVVFVTAPPGDESVRALRSGAVHVAAVPASVVPLEKRGFRVKDSPGLTTLYLVISTSPAAGPENPLADRRVRQALSLAIDRRALARLATGHEGTYAAQIVPQTVFGYSASLPPARYDPAAARALLRAVSERPVKLTLTHRELAEALRLAEAIRSMLNGAGFDVSLRNVPWQELRSAYVAQKVPLALTRWVFDNGDAGSFLRDCFRTRRAGSPDGAFNAGYSNAEMDRLIDESATLLDGSRRRAHLERAMALAQEDVPVVPLIHLPGIWGLARELEWQPRIDGRLLAHEMAFREKS